VGPAASSSQLWLKVPADIRLRLSRCLHRAAAEPFLGGERIIFFRADDVGVPGNRFSRLIDLFRRHQTPLTLGVVPSWLTGERWRCLLEVCGNDRTLWGWTQHGWRHLNHEPVGKKQEFGPSRPISLKRRDLRLGYGRLRALMGEALLPAFTPPWNRCDQETLTVLEDLGYKALSRDRTAQPAAPLTLPDYPVCVDLHTRKENDAEGGWHSLLKELTDSLSSGFCGIMIHHQRMNTAAFDFLNLLLPALKQWNHGRIVHLGTLIKERHGVVG